MGALKPDNMRLVGGCHCGASRIFLLTAKPLAPRACQCSFCRKHRARTVSDPEGSAKLQLAADILRYRFASRSADYLICGRCGVYLGAVAKLDGEMRATLNLNAFEDPQPELAATAVDYSGESTATKSARRRQRWTPVLLA